MTLTTAIQSNQPFKRKSVEDHPTLGTRWLTVCSKSGQIRYLKGEKHMVFKWNPTANDLVASDYEVFNRPCISIEVLNEVLGRHLTVDTKRQAIEEILARFN